MGRVRIPIMHVLTFSSQVTGSSPREDEILLPSLVNKDLYIQRRRLTQWMCGILSCYRTPRWRDFDSGHHHELYAPPPKSSSSFRFRSRSEPGVLRRSVVHVCRVLVGLFMLSSIYTYSLIRNQNCL